MVIVGHIQVVELKDFLNKLLSQNEIYWKECATQNWLASVGIS